MTARAKASNTRKRGRCTPRKSHRWLSRNSRTSTIRTGDNETTGAAIPLSSTRNISASPYSSSPPSPWAASAATPEFRPFFCSFSSPWHSLSGPHTFLHGYAYRYIPGMKVLRAPGMIAFLFAFPACVLAAIGLQRVLYPTDVSPQSRRNLAIGGGAAVILLLGVAMAPQGAVNAWTGLFWSGYSGFRRPGRAGERAQPQPGRHAGRPARGGL